MCTKCINEKGEPGNFSHPSIWFWDLSSQTFVTEKSELEPGSFSNPAIWICDLSSQSFGFIWIFSVSCHAIAQLQKVWLPAQLENCCLWEIVSFVLVGAYQNMAWEAQRVQICIFVFFVGFCPIQKNGTLQKHSRKGTIPKHVTLQKTFQDGSNQKNGTLQKKLSEPNKNGTLPGTITKNSVQFPKIADAKNYRVKNWPRFLVTWSWMINQLKSSWWYYIATWGSAAKNDNSCCLRCFSGWCPHWFFWVILIGFFLVISPFVLLFCFFLGDIPVGPLVSQVKAPIRYTAGTIWNPWNHFNRYQTHFIANNNAHQSMFRK